MVNPQAVRGGTLPPSGNHQASRNHQFPWDEFDTRSYLSHNYRDLRWDDSAILETIRDFFVDFHPGGDAAGIDLGAGPNLYPALAMLPLCSSITLVERASSNVDWLRAEVCDFAPSWDQFWALLCREPRYRAIANPRAALAARATVEAGDVFDLPARHWQVGTMFFVAESISPRQDEFEAAVRQFVRSLQDGAPFAAAFMENSSGYDVGDQRFPATPVDEAHIRAILEPETRELRVTRLGIGAEVLRPGYTGMISVCGQVRAG